MNYYFLSDEPLTKAEILITFGVLILTVLLLGRIFRKK